MDDFVKPEQERLALSGGQYIDIKKQLTYGETEDMYASWSPHIPTGGAAAQLDRSEVRTGKVLAYLTGWSLTLDGAPVPMSLGLPESDRRATIRGLHPDRFTEIHEAIEAHEAVMEKAREAQKKILAGSPHGAPISASQSVVAGHSAGSVN